MEITFLGTGTSQGVPVIGCRCPVCQSTDDRDKRLRTSALVSTQNKNFVIDAGPDFRQQLLRENISQVDAILITHEHNDHIIGMDDVRPLNFLHRKSMPVFAEKRVQNELKTRFAYIFDENPYPGAPRLTLHDIEDEIDLVIEDVRITPIRAWHGNLPVLGFRFGDFTYLSDLNYLEDEVLNKVKGTKYLAIDALHHSFHHSHLNLKQALQMIEIIQPDQAYLIHMSHRMGRHEEVDATLPENVRLAYDGMKISC